MDMAQLERRTSIYWIALGCVALLCCVLAFLQYRWIGEISRAEQDRLRNGLRIALARISEEFNSGIESACAALQPANPEIENLGRERAYSARFAVWHKSAKYRNLFSAIGLAIPVENDISLKILDMSTGDFHPAPWPEGWRELQEQLRARLRGGRPDPFALDSSTVLEIPRFGPPPPFPGDHRMREQDWLVVELNLDTIRDEVLPNLLTAYLGPQGYRAEVFVRRDPSNVIYRSEPENPQRIGNRADGSIGLFGIRFPEFGRRPPEQREANRRPPFGPPAPGGIGRWELVAQSQAGSLGALVEQTRRRNVAISAVILLLLMTTVVLLARFSRQAHRLANLQMNFVAGVSHELRTPLTVIRTAAFNLKGAVARNPAQVERYGGLIQEESEKLTAIVEQVLRFASARAGWVIGDKVPIAVASLIENVLRSRRHLLENSGFAVEQAIEPNVPPILADESALKQALQNLVDNAIKYGARLIRISAQKAGDGVQISIADHGPGIPADEQPFVFDPFFRGQRAINDQIHGTGLGLHLVKQIVEAHGGSIRLHSGPHTGAEFIIYVPAAPQEVSNDVTHSTHRG
jgi:signal transduction histidine kinase